MKNGSTEVLDTLWNYPVSSFLILAMAIVGRAKYTHTYTCVRDEKLKEECENTKMKVNFPFPL